jgi:uncharacterized membrane protein
MESAMADARTGPFDELAGRVGAVEKRLRAVEREMRWRMPSTIGTDEEDGPEAMSLAAEATALRESLRFDPLVRGNLVAARRESIRRPVEVPQIWPAAPQAPRATPPPLPRAQPVLREEAAENLESTIGRNWTSWVGAVVVVLGVCFFLKYAWDQGWLALSPAARVAVTIIMGVGFGGAGEWVRRRPEAMRGLAGTLTGIGVAIVMAAFFAASTMFDVPVLSPRVAMVGVCVTAAVGLWRAVRIDAMSVAVVALLGAYLAPAVLGSGHDESGLLMVYLGTLATVGWALAYMRPAWAHLRWFVWACTACWMGAWVLWYGGRGEHRVLGLTAVAYFFAGFIGEAYLTLQRGTRIAAWLEGSLATLSMLTTAATFAACYVLLPIPAEQSGWLHLSPIAAVALGLAGLHGLIAVSTASKQFARSSVVQAGALVTLAVPLAMGGVAVTIAWLVLAAALAALDWRRDIGGAARVWVGVLLALVVARLFSFDLMNRHLGALAFSVGEQAVTGWMMLAAVVAIVLHGIAWLLDGRRVRGSVAGLGSVVAAVGTAVFFVATLMNWHGEALTLLWLSWVALVAIAGRRGAALGYDVHAAVALFVVSCKWIAFDGLAPVVAHWDDPGTVPPLFNGVALAGAAILALEAWLAARARDAQTQALSPVGVGLIAFAALNFEILRAVDYFAGVFADFVTAKLVALSVLWAVIGLAAVVIGFAKDLRPLRYAALGLLGVTLVKILFVDLATVRPVYRILSFLAVGGLLLCVSFVYHRQGGTRQATAK